MNQMMLIFLAAFLIFTTHSTLPLNGSDSSSYIIKENDENGNTTQYVFNERSEQIALVKPDGISLHRELSDTGAITRIYSSNGEINYSFTYDEYGNLTAAIDHVHNQTILRSYNSEGKLIQETTLGDQTVTYAYGDDNELVQVTLPDHTGFFFSNDVIIRFGSHQETLYESYPSNEEPTEEEMVELKKEMDKEQTEIPSSKYSPILKFDPLNRLVQLTIDQQFKAIYTYDALQRRSSKKTFLWSDALQDWRESSTEYYLYQNDTEIAVLDETKAVKTLRIYKNGNGEELLSPRIIEIDGVPYSPIHYEGDSSEESSKTYSPVINDGKNDSNKNDEVSWLRWTLNLLMNWNEASDVGVIGRGELGNHVRITYINGMLNSADEVFKYLADLSEMHGGANIHYVFRETNGFPKDLLKAILICQCGYVSDHAKALAAVWKQMIEEMGGVDNGGTIIHYAHSLGAADTYMASYLMSEKELKMIKSFSFGSPRIIPQGVFGENYNYISRWDGVSPLGPYNYIKALMFDEPHVIFLKSDDGFPLQDHLISKPTYNKIMMGLSSGIVEFFGPLVSQ